VYGADSIVVQSYYIKQQVKINAVRQVCRCKPQNA
jgi:hypothetical protein